MNQVLIILAGIILFIPAFISLTYFVSSIWEKENRAAVFAGLQSFLMLALFVIFIFLARTGFPGTGAGLMTLACVLASGIFILLLFGLKIGANPKALEGTKGLISGEVERFDEREIVFARNRNLQPGSERYDEFYREHPELEDVDAERRKKGGVLGTPGAIDKPNQGPNLAAAMGHAYMQVSLAAPDKIRPNSLTGLKLDLDPSEAAVRIKGFARSAGADLVGICELNPLWLYSHRGMNSAEWGKEIESRHKYAVVFAVEMSLDMVNAAPHTPTIIESMHKYADGAVVGTQVASYIVNMGYSAKVDMVFDYDTLLVPLAVDAGLGELGRMGYLVTKEFGPRVRLAAVTTDMPLVPDRPVDTGVHDFCRICVKCAECCPSNSIPSGEPAEVNGTFRWKLNAETCFDYWGTVGTDCCICMKVCPYSHARTFPHKVILELCSRNKFSRRLFSAMDDLFYGKKPESKSPPDWAGFRKQS